MKQNFRSGLHIRHDMLWVSASDSNPEGGIFVAQVTTLRLPATFEIGNYNSDFSHTSTAVTCLLRTWGYFDFLSAI